MNLIFNFVQYKYSDVDCIYCGLCDCIQVHPPNIDDIKIRHVFQI